MRVLAFIEKLSNYELILQLFRRTYFNAFEMLIWLGLEQHRLLKTSFGSVNSIILKRGRVESNSTLIRREKMNFFPLPTIKFTSVNEMTFQTLLEISSRGHKRSLYLALASKRSQNIISRNKLFGVNSRLTSMKEERDLQCWLSSVDDKRCLKFN